MSYSDNAILTIHELFPHYGHSVDALTPRDVLEWKQLFVRCKIDQPTAESLRSELAAEHDTIPDVKQVLHHFVAICTRTFRKPKDEEQQSGYSTCAYCRGKGMASIVHHRNPFDTESVPCICKAGREWAEKCAAGTRPFHFAVNYKSPAVASEISDFVSQHTERALAWAKERGLDTNDENEFWQQWEEVKRSMAREMFKSVSDYEADEKEKKRRAAGDTARRLSSIMRVRPVHQSQVPDGWEVVICDKQSGSRPARPDAEGNYQPHPANRVVKTRETHAGQRALPAPRVGSFVKNSPGEVRVDDRELALAVYENGDERGWE